MAMVAMVTGHFLCPSCSPLKFASESAAWNPIKKESKEDKEGEEETTCCSWY